MLGIKYELFKQYSLSIAQSSQILCMTNLVNLDDGEKVIDNTTRITWLNFTKNNKNNLNIHFSQLRHRQEKTGFIT